MFPEDAVAIQRGRSRIGRQLKAQATREKYGAAMKPAPVVVRRVGDVRPAEIPGEVDQAKFEKRTVSPALDQMACAIGYDSYEAYLRSPHWKVLRMRVLTRDRWRCVLCGGKRRLHVHHDRYDSLGCEPLETLKTMCSRCHARIHS